MQGQSRARVIAGVVAIINFPVLLWLLYQASFFAWVTMTPNGERFRGWLNISLLCAGLSGSVEIGICVYFLARLIRRPRQLRGFPVIVDDANVVMDHCQQKLKINSDRQDNNYSMAGKKEDDNKSVVLKREQEQE